MNKVIKLLLAVTFLLSINAFSQNKPNLNNCAQLDSKNFNKVIKGKQVGLSFANSLKGKPLKKKHESLYWEFYERGFDQAVRLGDEWKAVKLSAKGGKLEFYNLKDDVGEENDVAAKYPNIVAKAEKAFADNRIVSNMWPLNKK